MRGELFPYLFFALHYRGVWAHLLHQRAAIVQMLLTDYRNFPITRMKELIAQEKVGCVTECPGLANPFIPATGRV